MLSVHLVLSTAQESASYGAGTFGLSLGGYLLLAIALWPVFRKAGLPGWGALIPILNIYLLIKIAGFHGALILLYLVPIVNLVMSIIVALRVGRAFGRSGPFSFFLLWLLSPVGYLIVGYGRSHFIGVGGQPGAQLG